MRLRARAWRRHALAGLLALAGSAPIVVPRSALAQPTRSGDVRQQVDVLRRDERYTFCTTPRRALASRPLTPRQRQLCPLAADVEGCEGFVKACNGDTADTESKKAPEDSTTNTIMHALGALAEVLVWLLLGLVVIAAAVPLVQALLRSRRDRRLADAPKPRNLATVATGSRSPEPEAITDADAALREADDHARRGELVPALRLYLSASLAALDRRGAVRLARHRTNGEYVRSCIEDASRTPLREIVREVDKVEFGKLAPTAEGVAQVASRANALVHAPRAPSAATSIVTGITGVMMLLSLAACSADRGTRTGPLADDPAGDELPVELLRHSGYETSRLGQSLATMPMPEPRTAVPIVLVDVTRVPLEDETQAHLLRWVEAGGILVLFGPPTAWPAELHVKEASAATRDLNVLTSHVYATGARVAVPRALTWEGSEAVAWLGKRVYSAHSTSGLGSILGVAGPELFTNVGVARPDNAAALVALIDIAASDRSKSAALRGVRQFSPKIEVRIARSEDGIPSPSNPFSALVQAGLGKGAWHALAAAMVLFLAFGIRHARARPTAPSSRRAFAEHVEATGAFYGRARALGHALASYGRFAEMRLHERVPRGGDPVHFLAARAKVAPEEAARVWKRATEARADDPRRGDELATIRDLRAMLVKALETG